MSDLKYTKEWLELSKSGKYEEAQELYFSRLLPEISRWPHPTCSASSIRHQDCCERECLLRRFE